MGKCRVIGEPGIFTVLRGSSVGLEHKHEDVGVMRERQAGQEKQSGLRCYSKEFVLCSAGGEGYEPIYLLEWSLGQLFGAWTGV